MPADPEMPSWVQWAASLMGLAGGGGALAKTVLAQSGVENRLTQLETDRDAHGTKLDKINDTVSRLDERSEISELNRIETNARAERERREIIDLLRGSR